MQLSLLEHTALEGVSTFGSTSGVYSHFQSSLGLRKEDLEEKVQAGAWGKTSKWKRKIRFIQQTLKCKGLIEKDESSNLKGAWALTEKGKSALTKPQAGGGLKIGFITPKGIAFWGDSREAAKLFKNEVEAIITSPPYLLTKEREYGGLGASEKQYVDTMVQFIEELLPMLTATGSIALNLGECTLKGTGQQSLYQERLLIALEDKLGLHLMQKFVWNNPAKCPTGYWTTKARQRVTQKTENIYWLSLTPKSTKASNLRVLQPYSPAWEKELERLKGKSDRAEGYKTRPSGQNFNEASFQNNHGGAIASNLLNATHEHAKSEYSHWCKTQGLPRHPAMMPIELAEFFVKFMTEEEDLVFDPFFGSGCTGFAAEKNNRYWAGSDLIKEYLAGASGRFKLETDFCS